MGVKKVWDVTKLPVWAQDKISLLEMRLAEMTRTVEDMRGKTPGPLYMEAWQVSGNLSRSTFYLPSKTVHFNYGGVKGMLQCANDDEGVRLFFTREDGVTGKAAIMPQSSNHILLVPRG
jgi:hypothetical protein